MTMNEAYTYPAPVPIEDNREQVEKDIQRYIRRNTPRKGAQKGVPPLHSDLLDYAVEVLWRVGIETCILFKDDGQRMTFDQVLRGLQDGAIGRFIQRIDELKELGIEVEVVEGETDG